MGKTHLSVALALKACQAGLSIYFITIPDLIIKLKKDHEAGRIGKGRSYYKSSLVIVDEVGYTPINRHHSVVINIKGNSYRLKGKITEK